MGKYFVCAWFFWVCACVWVGVCVCLWVSVCRCVSVFLFVCVCESVSLYVGVWLWGTQYRTSCWKASTLSQNIRCCSGSQNIRFPAESDSDDSHIYQVSPYRVSPSPLCPYKVQEYLRSPSLLSENWQVGPRPQNSEVKESTGRLLISNWFDWKGEGSPVDD